MYGLATLRIGSLDRRSSVTVAVLATFLGSFASVGSDSQLLLLLGAPLAFVWLVRTTITHAKSFEDAIRRIDEIERAVNQLASEDLLLFQSSHPSRGMAVGGRTGADTVYAVIVMSLLVLAAGGFLFWREVSQEHLVLSAYVGYVAFACLFILFSGFTYRRYRYLKQQSARRGLRVRSKRRRTLQRWGSHLRSRRRSSDAAAAGTASGDRTG